MNGDGMLEDIARAPGFMHDELVGLVHVLEWVSDDIDMLAIALMLIGAARFVAGIVAAELQRDAALRLRGIDRNRMELGRYILAALELLIVSDIIHTALSLALGDLLFLAVLVLVRAAVSFFYDRDPGDRKGARAMTLNDKQAALCAENTTDFSDLRAVIINCTLKRPEEASHTALLLSVPEEIMRRAASRWR